MSGFEDMVDGLRQSIEIPGQVREKTEAAFARIAENVQSREPALPVRKGRGGTSIWRRRAALLAAAALAVSVISVSASVYLRWSRGLQEGMEASDAQYEMLEKSGLAASLDQACVQSGVTVTAQQSVADNYALYLSFRVEGYRPPEGAEPDFENVRVLVGEDEGYYAPVSLASAFYGETLSDAGPGGGAVYPDGIPLAQKAPRGYVGEDGGMEYLICMTSEEKGYFLGKPVSVELTNLGTAAEETFAADVKGAWTFAWTLSGEEGEPRELEPDAPVGESGCTLLRAELSPISLCLTFQCADVQDGDARGTVPEFTGFRMKDGTVCTGLHGGSTHRMTPLDSNVRSSIIATGKVIDADQVESLLFLRPGAQDSQSVRDEDIWEVRLESL